MQTACIQKPVPLRIPVVGFAEHRDRQADPPRQRDVEVFPRTDEFAARHVDDCVILFAQRSKPLRRVDHPNAMRLAHELLLARVVLIIGVLAGRVWGTWFDYSQLFDQAAQRNSEEVRMRITALSQLRLGRIHDSIDVLEMPLDNQVLMIAFGESKTLTLNPKKMTPNCLTAPQMAKAYRSLYPSVQSSTDPPPEHVLAQVPDMTFSPECKGALCTLLKNHATEVAKETN